MGQNGRFHALNDSSLHALQIRKKRYYLFITSLLESRHERFFEKTELRLLWSSGSLRFKVVSFKEP